MKTGRLVDGWEGESSRDNFVEAVGVFSKYARNKINWRILFIKANVC